jgi:hypothetical protein
LFFSRKEPKAFVPLRGRLFFFEDLFFSRKEPKALVCLEEKIKFLRMALLISRTKLSFNDNLTEDENRAVLKKIPPFARPNNVSIRSVFQVRFILRELYPRYLR